MRVIVILQALVLAAVSAQAQVGSNQDLLDPNLAETRELTEVPHIDEALASAIVEGRPFTSAAQLDELLSASLDEEQRAEVYEHLFRQLDLNSASEEVIMLIPGMSGRMVHEFEEYRPYTSLEQFRREIGKYVDEDEVARLESYVTLE